MAISDDELKVIIFKHEQQLDNVKENSVKQGRLGHRKIESQANAPEKISNVSHESLGIQKA